MAISQEDIQKVREASDIVAIVGERVPLRQRGRDFWCCCPFHNEKTPSCKVDPSTQLWHCFGCGEGGSVFDFIMKADDLSFPDAVRYLAQRANIDISEDARGGMPNSRKARLKDACAEAAAFYHTQLMRAKSSEAAAARSYLGSRGLGGSVPATWNLGFAPGRQALVRHLRSRGFTNQDLLDANLAMEGKSGGLRDRFFNRIMFPIRDAQGDCIAFGGRVVGQGEPKYLNSQETPLFHKSRVLYGLDKAKSAITSTGTAIIVEGYTDVIALHEGGIANAVATLGTALTFQHIRLISRYSPKRIVYLFDGDAAGQRAADRALEFIDGSMTPEAGAQQVELLAVTLPDNLDPAEFVAAKGAETLRTLVAEAKPLVAFGMERRIAAFDTSTPEGRSRAFAQAISVLAPIKDSLLAKDYAVQLAGRLRMREQDALEELSKLKKPARTRDANVVAGEAHARPNETPPEASLSLAERNRRRFEQELLSLATQYPSIALANADAIAQVNWHSPLGEALAQSLLAQLADNPASTPAMIVAHAAEAVPRGAGILTSAQLQDGKDPKDTFAYLAEELAIGDLEDTIATLRAQLAQENLPASEHELLFQSVADLQKTVNRMKAAHRPLL